MKLPQCVLLLSALAATAHGQTVTAEAKVRIDGRVQTVRKINGRWWSPDNRQMTPDKDSFIWWIGSERNRAYTFHHHRPVKLALAESLHLFMSPTATEDLLGQPNESSDHDRSRLWMYYAENGTALFIRFIKDELTEARYERPDYGVSGKQVQSIARELDGRDIFKILADRSWQQSSPEAYAKFHGQTLPGQTPGAVHTVTISTASADSRPVPPKRRIASDLADSVKVGMTRADVVQILGEPSGGMHISGGESDTETLTYALDSDGSISFAMEKGKVARISR